MNMNKDNKDPDEIAKCIVSVLIEILDYSEEQANAFANKMISDVQSKNYNNNTSNIIIHHGLEGYLNYKDDEILYVEDIENIIETII